MDKNTLVVFTSDNGPWLVMKDHGGSAGPLYEGKASTYEGGLRVPAIAWWPGKIKANVTSEALVSAIDLFPTVGQLTGASLPKERELDGTNLSDILFGQKKSVREILPYYFNETLYAIRKGSWKIHFITHPSYSPEPPKVLTTPLLYNIENDPGEKYDVAKDNPEVVAELTKEFDKQKNSITPAPSELDKTITAKQTP